MDLEHPEMGGWVGEIEVKKFCGHAYGGGLVALFTLEIDDSSWRWSCEFGKIS